MSRLDYVRASMQFSRARLLYLTVFGTVVAILGIVLLTPLPVWFATALSTVGMTAFLLAVSLVRVTRLVLTRPDAFPTVDQRLTVTHDGLLHEAPATQTRLAWPLVRHVATHGAWLLLWTGPSVGLALPRRAFATQAQERAFLATVRAFRADPSPADASEPAPGRPPIAQGTFSLGYDDFVALRRFVIQEQSRRRIATPIGALILGLATFAGGMSLALDSDVWEVTALFAIAGLGAVVAGVPFVRMALSGRYVRNQMRAEPARYSTAPRYVGVWPDHVEVRTEGSRSVLPWNLITRIAEDGPRIYLFVDATRAFVVRQEAFGARASEVAERARRWRAEAGPGTAHGDGRHAREDPFAPPEE